MKNQMEFSFLISSFADGHYIKDDMILDWIKLRNNIIKSDIRQIPLVDMRTWKCDENLIYHNTGKFFSIEGIHVKTNKGITNSWDQPIINQPEIGFLGMLTKKNNGVLHFLVQAKIEPGNINLVQLSPTLQATKSNYTCAHKGKVPRYLEYFNGEKEVSVLVDQLQSEQGARFLRKRNRNIIVEISESEDVEIHEGYIWMTLKQIKNMMKFDNVVNMDTRTVVSCINFGTLSTESIQILESVNLIGMTSSSINTSYLYSLLTSEGMKNSFASILSWITKMKFSTDLYVNSKSLSELIDWKYNSEFLEHKNGKYFSVIGVRVEIENREVQIWDQPMVKPAQEGLIAFLVKKINGIYHFLIQAKVEPGNFDIIELAPTVQCLTGNYRKGFNEYEVPYISDVLNAAGKDIWFRSYQSEEGGRFFKEQNLNMIVEVSSDFSENIPENYCWMTLNQLSSFVVYNNYLNIAARSLLASINLIDNNYEKN
jgi:oxidase EvaA